MFVLLLMSNFPPILDWCVTDVVNFPTNMGMHLKAIDLSNSAFIGDGSKVMWPCNVSGSVKLSWQCCSYEAARLALGKLPQHHVSYSDDIFCLVQSMMFWCCCVWLLVQLCM